MREDLSISSVILERTVENKKDEYEKTFVQTEGAEGNPHLDVHVWQLSGESDWRAISGLLVSLQHVQEAYRSSHAVGRL